MNDEVELHSLLDKSPDAIEALGKSLAGTLDVEALFGWLFWDDRQGTPLQRRQLRSSLRDAGFLPAIVSLFERHGGGNPLEPHTPYERCVLLVQMFGESLADRQDLMREPSIMPLLTRIVSEVTNASKKKKTKFRSDNHLGRWQPRVLRRSRGALGVL